MVAGGGMYPDTGFVSLLGVGIVCGAVFNVVMFVVTRSKKRSQRLPTSNSKP